MSDREIVMQHFQDAIEASGNNNKWRFVRLDIIEKTLAILKEQEPVIVRCKDCKHWDITTRKEGNDCILGPWENAVCDMLRDWDTYGDLGESFRRTNGDWFCADGERR